MTQTFLSAAQVDELVALYEQGARLQAFSCASTSRVLEGVLKLRPQIGEESG